MKKVVQVKSGSDVVELEAFGLTSSMDRARPIMVFKEKDGEATLPVWLSPVDAGIALTQHQTQTAATSPHDVTLNILKNLGIKLESCHFAEVKGHQQYVDLRFSGSRKLKNIRVRADHAISFCLQARVKFFCTRDFMAECRTVDSDLRHMPPQLKTERRRGGSAYLN